MSPLPHYPKPASNRLARLARVLVVLVAVCALPALSKAQVPVAEPISITDTVSFPDTLDKETITTTDVVTVTPLIAVTAPVVFYSAGSLGFNGVSTQSIQASAIGQAPLMLSSAVISPSSTFTIGPISCTNGATSLPTTLPAGGVCTFTISSLSPGTATSGTLVFTDNAALSNVASTPAGPSFAQSIALNDAASTTPPPPPPPAVVTIPITETITVTDTPSFPDALDKETITTTDVVTVTPLIAVTAPVVFYSAGSLGFNGVTTQSINVSDIGEAPLTLSSAATSPSSAFTIGPISCTNGATSLPTTLPAGGACTFTISSLSPGTTTTGTLVFTDNAALSNVASTPAGPSFAQSIALNNAASSTPPPPPPPAVVNISIPETITVTDTPSFLDALDNETIKITDAVTVQVIHVTPIITWVTPAAITYGTALSGTQLDATATNNGASVPGTFAYTPASSTVLGVGSQMLSVSFTPNDTTTYTTATAQVTLIVNQATLTITANSTSKTYGQTVTFAGTEFTASGLLNGDIVSSVNLASPGAAAAATVAGSPYAITPSAAVGTGLGNYAINYANGTLTVTPALLTINVDNKSRLYGQTNPPLTGSILGLQNSDNITATYSTTATPTRPVGTYPITDPLNDPNGRLPNYTVTVNNGTLTVTSAALIITANNQTKTYGQTVAFAGTEFTAAGLLNADKVNNVTLTSAGAAATATVAGSPYAITPSAAVGSGLSNYNISYVNGTLTVTQAVLTITADNKTKILNAPLPSFTATYSGFVNSDGPGSLTGSLNFTTNATASSPVGAYTITPSGQSSSSYSIVYKNGTLTITYQPSGMCDGDFNHQILQPINADGTSVWKQGRTIPAKFRVCDANGVSIGTPGVVASFNLTQIIAGTVTSVDETVSSTTPDTAFRWDPTGQQWIFNISSTNLPANQTYVYTIMLNDGSSIMFRYGLR